MSVLPRTPEMGVRELRRTFSGRTHTILHSSKLKPSQIRRLVSMLSDGATLRQAAHQAHVSLQTALLWKRKMQRIPENAETRCFQVRPGWTTHTLTRRCQYGKARKGGDCPDTSSRSRPASTPAAMCFSDSEAGDWQGQAIRRMLFSDI